MKKYLVLFLCIRSLCANDLNGSLEKNLTKFDKNSSKKIMKYINFANFKEFENIFFKLPSDAKILSSISIKYIDKNGIMQEKCIDINKSFDWQEEFVLQKNPKPELSKIFDVSVTSEKKDDSLNNNLLSKELNIDFDIIKYCDNLKLIPEKNYIKIITKDKLKQHFMNKRTKTLEIEFFSDNNINQGEININKKDFTKAYIIPQNGYFQMFIKVNGNFTIKKDYDGYIVLKQ